MAQASSEQDRTETLYVNSVDTKPQDFDWDTATNLDYGSDEGTWRFVEHRLPEDGDTADCDDCGDPIAYSGFGPGWEHVGSGEDDHDHDATPDAEYHLSHVEGPMMNYWYPVEIGDMDTAADLLADLPLCPVEVNGETGIALTGGGMDLSWEICEAYIRLGHLPPFHFVSQLPRMADRWTARRELVLAAGRRSCQIMQEWAQRGAERLEETAEWMRNRA